MCRAIITQCDCDRCRGGQHFGKLYGIDYCPPHRAPMADIRTSSSVGQPLGAFCGPSSFAPCKDVKWVAWADPAACHFKSENKVKDGDNKTTQPPPLNPSFLRSIDPLLLGLEPSGPLSADNLAKADDAATPAAMAAPVPAAASSAAPLVAATAAQAQANKNSNGNLPWPTAGLTDVNPPLYPSTPSSLPMIDNLPTSAQPGSATTQSPPQQTKARYITLHHRNKSNANVLLPIGIQGAETTSVARSAAKVTVMTEA